MDDKKYEFGQRIQKLRRERGYTNEVLAEKAGISSRFLSDIERGEKGISTETLQGISTALRVTTDYLLYGSELDSKAIEESIAGFNSIEQKQLKSLFQGAIKILDDIPDKNRR